MIVRMKELWLFTPASSVDETITKLGELGVVEIREVVSPAGADLEHRDREIERTQKAINLLASAQDGNGNNDVLVTDILYTENDPKRLTNRILTTVEINTNGRRRLKDLQSQLKWYEVWGKDTNPADIEYLEGQGIYIRLYEATPDQVDGLVKNHCVEVFPEREQAIPLALISDEKDEQLDLKQVYSPTLPLSELRRQLERKERQMAKVNRYLEDQSQNLGLLRDYLKYLQDHRNIVWAVEGMGDIEGKLKYLHGYLPADQMDLLSSVAKDNSWGYRISEPKNPKEVPVYLRNPRWIKIINPVLRFIDIVPGYREVDVSIYFLIAFALFFAMLVGDAGYGLLLLLLTIFFRKKIPSQMRWLSYVLSGATIAWGVLSGTYFGSEEIASLPWLNNLIIAEVSSFGVENIDFMMHLSFLIGAVHLTTAHLIRVVQFANSIKALSEIGWIAIMWGLFLLAEQLVLGEAMPAWSHWLFISGALLVTLFSQESSSLLKSIVVSVSNLPLSLINGFSDIVSYVRLFAVGLATATVAASFNQMILASGISNMGVLQIIGSAIALFLGHSLNIALALMAVMVHGLRLNMLEFAGHLGVQFSGEAYKPFKLMGYKSTTKGKKGRRILNSQ
ncbi:MAG: hypothetical protein HKN87_00575 [Saprospiraceae bacterium]|nr:hypothetical protein [Saprospiraceae bacterium]